MNFLTSFFLMLSAVSTIALADCEKLTEFCSKTGFGKVQSQAQAYGCAADMTTFKVSGTDCRIFNPSKYIWYSADSKCADGSNKIINILVQHYDGKCL